MSNNIFEWGAEEGGGREVGVYGGGKGGFRQSKRKKRKKEMHYQQRGFVGLRPLVCFGKVTLMLAQVLHPAAAALRLGCLCGSLCTSVCYCHLSPTVPSGLCIECIKLQLGGPAPMRLETCWNAEQSWVAVFGLQSTQVACFFCLFFLNLSDFSLGQRLCS